MFQKNWQFVSMLKMNHKICTKVISKITFSSVANTYCNWFTVMEIGLYKYILSEQLRGIVAEPHKWCGTDFLDFFGVGTADYLNFNKNHKIDPLWNFCFWHLKFGIRIWPKYQNPMYTSIKSPQRWNFWFFWIFPIFSWCDKWNQTLPPEHHENKYFLSFSPLELLG